MASRANAAHVREVRAALEGRTTELELQGAIQDALDLMGWKHHHETDSRRTHPGWPDVFAAHPDSGWLAMLELKTSTGKVTGAQLAWLQAMGWSTEHGPLWVSVPLKRLVGLIRPGDLDHLLTVLARVAS